jgi:DNA-binding transcriptional MerR regulator
VDDRIAPKEYYSIGEVCDITELKPHVIRYWESQFSSLNPSKNQAGNRVFRRREIKLIQLIRHLLYTEKYTIEGAQQKLDQLRSDGRLDRAANMALDSQTVRDLRKEADELVSLLSLEE